MAIKRELKAAELDCAFFKVEERPVFINKFFNGFHSIPDYKAIVDLDNETALSVVSKDYRLITNEEAYRIAGLLIPKLFEGKTIHDFMAFNIRMSKSKGSCIIDLILPSDGRNLFGDKNECYTPFIRIWNSYNKTTKLKYEIGFCRWICLNGVIFGEVGFKFSAAHTSRQAGFRLDDIVEAGSKKLINVKTAWTEFEKKLTKVREIPMPQSLVLAMYCKAFDISIDPKDLSAYQRDSYATQAKKLIDDGKEYFSELGNNGYAMYNVLTDYASYPPVNSFNMNGYQQKVGQWLTEIVNAYDSNNFKLSEFIGEYLDTAAFLESLISNKATRMDK